MNVSDQSFRGVLESNMDAKKDSSYDISPDNASEDVSRGETIELEGRNGQFHRSFSPRQVHVLSSSPSLCQDQPAF